MGHVLNVSRSGKGARECDLFSAGWTEAQTKLRCKEISTSQIESQETESDMKRYIRKGAKKKLFVKRELSSNF